MNVVAQKQRYPSIFWFKRKTNKHTNKVLNGLNKLARWLLSLEGSIKETGCSLGFEEKELSCRPTQSVLWRWCKTPHSWGRIYRGSVEVWKVFLVLLLLMLFHSHLFLVQTFLISQVKTNSKEQKLRRIVQCMHMCAFMCEDEHGCTHAVDAGGWRQFLPKSPSTLVFETKLFSEPKGCSLG